jgi:hypothetical protein
MALTRSVADRCHQCAGEIHNRGEDCESHEYPSCHPSNAQDRQRD